MKVLILKYALCLRARFAWLLTAFAAWLAASAAWPARLHSFSAAAVLFASLTPVWLDDDTNGFERYAASLPISRAELALSRDEKAEACREIEELMDEGFPIFNLRSAFPAIVDNAFPTPCRQCVVMEDGKLSVCGRCIDVPGLCERCGYFFAAEYALVFRGEVRVIAEMLRTYTRYV